MGNNPLVSWPAAAGLVVVLSGASLGAGQSMPAAAADRHTVLVRQYCVSCHNSRTRIAGLALDDILGAPVERPALLEVTSGGS